MITPINSNSEHMTQDVYFACEKCNLCGIIHFEEELISLTHEEDIRYLKLCCARCRALLE